MAGSCWRRKTRGEEGWRRTEGVLGFGGRRLTAYKGQGAGGREQATAARALSVSVRREEGRDGREEEGDGVRTSKGYGPGVGRPRRRRERGSRAREGFSPKTPCSIFFLLLETFSISVFRNFDSKQTLSS
jgi:hypothetical protein